MKKKDLFYIVIFICGFIGIIGLLMAWSDGYLDGTFIADALKVIFPTAIITYLLMTVISFWYNKFSKKPLERLGILFLICAAISFLLVMLPISMNIKIKMILLGIAITIVTLIVFLIDKAKK